MRTGAAWLGLLFSSVLWANDSQENSASTSELENSALESSSSDRPEPTDLPPRVPPTVPQSLSEAAEKASVVVNGEFRSALLVARLDTLDARVSDQNPSLNFVLPFVSLGVQAPLGHRVETTIGVRLDEGAVVGSWNTQGLWDARVRAKVGSRSAIAVGLMPSLLGFVSSESGWGESLGGVDQWLPLSWASAFSPARVLGVNLERALGTQGYLRLQVAQNPEWIGGGAATASLNVERDIQSLVVVDSYLAGRFSMGKALGLSDGTSQLAIGVRLESGPARLMSEVLLGLEENGPRAWEIYGSWKLPWRIWGGDSWEIMGRFRDVNPTSVTEEDRLWQGAAGLLWRPSVPEWTELSLGLIWEADMPEDVAEAIEHEASLGLHVRF